MNSEHIANTVTYTGTDGEPVALGTAMNNNSGVSLRGSIPVSDTVDVDLGAQYRIPTGFVAVDAGITLGLRFHGPVATVLSRPSEDLPFLDEAD